MVCSESVGLFSSVSPSDSATASAGLPCQLISKSTNCHFPELLKSPLNGKGPDLGAVKTGQEGAWKWLLPSASGTYYHSAQDPRVASDFQQLAHSPSQRPGGRMWPAGLLSSGCYVSFWDVGTALFTMLDSAGWNSACPRWEQLGLLDASALESTPCLFAYYCLQLVQLK